MNEIERRVEMAEIKTDIKYIKQALDVNTEQHKELKDMIEGWIEASPTKFASKGFQNAVIGFTVIVLPILITYMING